MVLSELDRLGRWDVKGSVYTIRPIVGKQVTYDRGPRQYETTVEQGFKPWDLAPASEDEGKEDEEAPDEDFLASMIKDKQNRAKNARIIALKVDQKVDEGETSVKKEKKDGPTPTIAKKAPTKKKEVVVIDDDDEEKLIPFEAFSARLIAHIGDDRDLVDKLLHKYDPVPMAKIKALSTKKALSFLCDIMCYEEEGGN